MCFTVTRTDDQQNLINLSLSPSGRLGQIKKKKFLKAFKRQLKNIMSQCMCGQIITHLHINSSLCLTFNIVVLDQVDSVL